MARTVNRHVTLDSDDVNWFNDTYPEGTFGWLFTMLLKEFRKAHTITPQDYAAIGARELKKRLEEGES
jgi:hypothetical protein